jgi:hypothetical protein
MRHNTLTYQSRIVGAAVLVIGALVALYLVRTAQERNAGVSYHTLSHDVPGVETGSIVTLNGFEIGHVTGVMLETASENALQSADNPLFRVEFRIQAPVSFPRDTIGLAIESVNPVVPARLVVKQLLPVSPPGSGDMASEEASTPNTIPCTEDGTEEDIPPGGCVPMIARAPNEQPGFRGLMAEGRATLREVRAKTLKDVESTLERYRQMADKTEDAVKKFSELIAETKESNKRFASMLNDEPGGLLALPGSLENAATRVADVSERLHGDMLLRVDQMVAPETIASLARAVANLEDLIATSGRQTQATLENLATITQSLNRITWQLERDPVGFLRGSGRGTR